MVCQHCIVITGPISVSYLPPFTMHHKRVREDEEPCATSSSPPGKAPKEGRNGSSNRPVKRGRSNGDISSSPPAHEVPPSPAISPPLPSEASLQGRGREGKERRKSAPSNSQAGSQPPKSATSTRKQPDSAPATPVGKHSPLSGVPSSPASGSSTPASYSSVAATPATPTQSRGGAFTRPSLSPHAQLRHLKYANGLPILAEELEGIRDWIKKRRLHNGQRLHDFLKENNVPDNVFDAVKLLRDKRNAVAHPGADQCTLKRMREQIDAVCVDKELEKHKVALTRLVELRWKE